MTSDITRRRALGMISGLGIGAVLAACGESTSDASDSSSTPSSPTDATDATSATTPTSATGSTGDCTPIPEETAGPYPGDGSNGVNVLTEDGVVRSDIRASFGDLSGTAEGVPLSIELTVVDASDGCVPLAGAAVYLWHCDREGRYSLYSDGATDQNYLRGVQEADGNGIVRFSSIFPACYSGRWPHIHFEVFPDLATATSAGQPLATSQLALPADVCDVVYATDGYSQSISNVAQTSLSTDNVFADDGAARQLATTSGNVSDGYTAVLTVSV